MGGLSPHGRGNLLYLEICNLFLGPIPARAGKPIDMRILPLTLRAYPRTGGETFSEPAKQQAGRGPIPARAGKPELHAVDEIFNRAYPRTGGETDKNKVGQMELTGLSPHGRGNQIVRSFTMMNIGPIPARAGKPFR